MNIKCIPVGYMEVNCYLLTDGTHAAFVDPGEEADRLLSELEKTGAKLDMILLTHGHFDHYGAVSDIVEKTGAKVYIHKEDADMLSDNSKNLSYLGNTSPKPCSADIFFNDGDEIKLGNSIIRVYHTPGHSAGSVTFLCDNAIIDGDLLFCNSIGRFDHGDLKTELKSLKQLMDTFDDATRVFPGHGPSTTIGEERRNNPYILNHIN